MRSRLRLPPIVRLVSRCGPLAVIRRVMPVVIDALNPISPNGWFRPHVRVEVFKRREPSFADSDSSPSVIRIGMVVSVQTPSPHVAPRVVFRTVTQAMGSFVVAKVVSLTPIALQTAARLSSCAWGYGDMCAAVAYRIPEALTGMLTPVTKSRKDQSALSFSCPILRSTSRHSMNTTMIGL